jgi:short-subunit dehydrogenase
MRMNGGGRIVNISSIGGKLGVPHLAAYCASKFALTGFSQSVRAELARENILITTVCPGLMRTGSIFNAWFKGRHREEFAWFAIAGSMPFITMNGESAARRIADAAKHGDAELLLSWPARVAAAVAGVTPALTAAASSAANRLLPASTDDVDGERSHSGWQSGSAWAPSTFTRLSEWAAVRNNELP